MHAPAVTSSALFATPAARPATATAVTLLLAVAAAAVVALYGEPSLAAAAAVAPSVPTLPQRPGDKPMHALQMIRELIAGLHKALAERRRLASVGSLRDVDDRTLADLGVARSEITSIEAESRRCTAMTRQRIVRAVGHA
jgi:uncharacterized protein YjiS (DUF1127 family)